MRQRVHRRWIGYSDKGVYAHLPVRRILLSSWPRVSPETLWCAASCLFGFSSRCCCGVWADCDVYLCFWLRLKSERCVIDNFTAVCKENGFEPSAPESCSPVVCNKP